jgi:hypothetical protein
MDTATIKKMDHTFLDQWLVKQILYHMENTIMAQCQSVQKEYNKWTFTFKIICMMTIPHGIKNRLSMFQ